MILLFYDFFFLNYCFAACIVLVVVPLLSVHAKVLRTHGILSDMILIYSKAKQKNSSHFDLLQCP